MRISLVAAFVSTIGVGVSAYFIDPALPFLLGFALLGVWALTRNA